MSWRCSKPMPRTPSQKGPAQGVGADLCFAPGNLAEHVERGPPATVDALAVDLTGLVARIAAFVASLWPALQTRRIVKSCREQISVRRSDSRTTPAMFHANGPMNQGVEP